MYAHMGWGRQEEAVKEGQSQQGKKKRRGKDIKTLGLLFFFGKLSQI